MEAEITNFIATHTTNPSECSDWKLILTKDEIAAVNQKIADFINKKFLGENVILVCILKGAIYFHADLSRLLEIPHSEYFVEASSYKNSQTQSECIELLSVIVPDKFINKKVVLIDELYDNGNTLNNVKAKIVEVANVNPSDIFTCTIFKKDKKTTCPDPDLYGIVVPNVWLVGYGLDDKQEKRSWPYLFAVPKAEGIELTMDDELFDNSEFYEEVRTIIKLNI